jgi:hypothetical protein
VPAFGNEAFLPRHVFGRRQFDTRRIGGDDFVARIAQQHRVRAERLMDKPILAGETHSFSGRENVRYLTSPCDCPATAHL